MHIHARHMYYCALSAHVLCMVDLVIMPERLVLIATYTPVGKVSGWLDFDPMQGGPWAWLAWGFRVLYHL